MNKNYGKRIAPFLLSLNVLLAGCGKKSNCEIPSRHVHKYTKEISDDITIQKYMDSETLNTYGYNWNEDYIEINKIDEAVYKVLGQKKAFEGEVNWSYLFQQMENCHDYLMYYYEYTTTETYTYTDSDGNKETRSRTVHHDGWHRDPYDSDNTGKVRLFHSRFYGYRIICEDGKFKLEKSPLVDDIREIIYEYPYFCEKPIEEVYYQTYLSRYELRHLKPEDFDVFVGPDLENRNLEPVVKKTLN